MPQNALSRYSKDALKGKRDNCAIEILRKLQRSCKIIEDIKILTRFLEKYCTFKISQGNRSRSCSGTLSRFFKSSMIFHDI